LTQVLTVFSADCPDLTIVDLPGITRIAIGGQPKNIEEITKSMVTKYCSDPKTVILAVIPANQDLSTSESLQMAMNLDPEGKRTLGVITKVFVI
jgi:replication fork clamp-binding protein CrfC